MTKITTIEDDNGDVFQGAEQDTSTPGVDIGAGILSLGLIPVADAIAGDDGTRTVKINGEEHTGHEVEEDDDD